MSGLALSSLPLFFLIPGYVAASSLNLLKFRTQSWVERLLWAVALSLPLSLILSVHPGLPVATAHVTECFFALLVVAIGLCLRDWRRDGKDRRPGWSREATIAAGAAIFLVLYCLLAPAPVSWHGGLYEAATWQDWNVRIQLVNSAIRGGNHPGNPMFAPAGKPAPLHYYYFWYVLCARMHDFVPVDARAILTASCAGSALSLEAFLFLSVKYLGSPRSPLRRQCTALLLAGSIIGLDLIASAAAWAMGRVYPDLQFWLSDRSPGWLHMALWSPHHVAGLICCGLGTLLLVRSLDVGRAQQGIHAGLAGLCFASSVGTSSFITVLFASACGFLFVDAIVRRQWRFVQTTAAASLVGLLASLSFLHGILRAQPGGSQPAGHLLVFWPRYAHQSLVFVWVLVRGFYHLVLHRAVLIPVPGTFVWTQRLMRPPVALCLFALDFGFFVFVLVWQARTDLLAGRPMARQARVLWLIFAGIAVPGCLLNSAALQSNNDFGRHAGFCMRYVLLLWASPMVADFLSRVRKARQARQRLRLSGAARAALVCAILGLLGQAAQIILDRVHMPLSAADLIPQAVVAERVPRLAFRFAQIQQAMAAADRITPVDGIVQSNPHSRLQPIFLLYTKRQMAASDDGCNTPFGGDPRACVPVALQLIQLFGGSGPHFHGNSRLFRPPVRFNAALVTPGNFDKVCASLKLDALAATYVDPAWSDPASWVWQLQPAFENSTVRVIPCPAAGRKRS